MRDPWAIAWGLALLAAIATSPARAEAPAAAATGAEAPPPASRAFEVRSLIGALDFPRDDADSQERARDILTAALETHGLAVERDGFDWRGGRAVTAGTLWILGALLLELGLLRRGRWAAVGIVGATCLVGLGLVTLAGGLDRLLPVTPAANLEVVVEPRGAALREVLLGAHYDSKTELFDHVDRVVWIGFVVLAAAGALATMRAHPARASRLGMVAAVGLALLGAHFTSGRWLAKRGHGIVDDAAACGVLVAQAGALHQDPLQHTRVRCVWWAGEETGAQGSRSDSRPMRPRPDAVVNLECLGAGPRLGYAGLEWTGRGWSRADARLVAALDDAAHRPLVRVPFPIVSDAGIWRRHGVPAITLLDLPAHGWAPRHLHGAGDQRDKLDLQALDASEQILDDWLRSADAATSGALPPAADAVP